jgi:DNA-binding GntR family transcriptional regulator
MTLNRGPIIERHPAGNGSIEWGNGLGGRQNVTLVHTRLREAILSGKLSPGSPLSQVRLAEELGVSRTPLREALRLLEREGLVDSETNRRVRVADFSVPDLEQLYAMRIQLEALGIRLTVPRLAQSELRQLEKTLADMEAAAEVQDYAGWEGPHRAFHQGLVAHAGDRLIKTISQLSDHAERYRHRYTVSSPQNWARGTGEHRDIFEACRAGDPAVAAGRLARHYATVSLGLIAVLQPEYEPAAIRVALRMVTSSEK